MSLSTLRLVILALIFAWAQVCCCQAGAVLGVIQGAGGGIVGGGGETPSTICCSACPSGGTEPPRPGLPCHDHGDCGGCMPRSGSMPEGPAELAADLMGELAPAPATQWAEPMSILWGGWWGGQPGALGIREMAEPRCLACTALLRLHCALVV